ncbi:MAG: hypothetical protein MUC84_10435 [Solirubrobacteraceae bacterium]|jgi:hypothetical protein|nr:hypothetical protein [Solirubrobacteraceae bacterium]
MALHARHAVLLAALCALVALAAVLRAGGTATTAPRGEPGGALYRLSAAQAERDGALELTASLRAATFTFDPSIAPADREILLDAVARSRPDARRLVALVDGLVDIRLGRPAQETAIATTLVGGPRYPITLDLARIWARAGQRGVDRVMLHELAHVLDHALLPDALVEPLAADVPAGWSCEQAQTGACTIGEERFAESFAKWATGDIGVNLQLGYEVLPPATPLEQWGVPLARFGR